MTIPVSFLINDAAVKIGDPNKVRVDVPTWLLFYNMSARELAEKANVVQYRATFNLSTEKAFPYPDEMTTMSRLEVTETPDDDDSWRVLGEKFEDEFRAMTSGLYPQATTPDFYFADRLGFYLIPRCTAAIAGAARITYFGLPDQVTDQAADFPMRLVARDYVMRRMVVYGLVARHRHDAAATELAQWQTDVGDLTEKFEDPSDDRRSAIRTRARPLAGMR